MPADDITKSPSRRHAVVTHIIGGYVNTVLLLIQGVAIIPLYLSALGTTSYGLWLATGGALAWLGVLDLGIGSFMLQRCAAAHGSQRFADLRGYVVVGTKLAALLCCMIWVLGFASWPWWSRILRLNVADQEALASAFFVAVVSLGMSVISETLRSVCVGVQRTAVPAVVEALATVFALVATVVGLALSWGVFALALGFLARAIICVVGNGLYVIVLMPALPACGTQKAVWADFVATSPTTAASRIITGLGRNLEPVIITYKYGPELTVIYAMTVRAMQAIEPFINQLVGSSGGAFAHLIAGGGATVAHNVRRAAIIIAGGAGILAASYAGGNLGFVTLWVGSQNYGGVTLTFLIAISSISGLSYRFLATVVTASGQFALTNVVAIAEVLVRIVLIVSIIGTMGAESFPVVSIVTSIAGGAVLLINNVNVAIKEGYRKATELYWVIGVSMVLAAGAAGMASALPTGSWYSWSMGMVILLIFVGALVLATAPTMRAQVMPAVSKVFRS